MKKLNFSRVIIVLAVILIGILPSFAHDFEVDGIYYNITNETVKTVAVTYKGSNFNSYFNEYTGSVVIPSSVTYNGTTYSVVSIGYYAFENCSGLKSITIPNSVTSIRDWAFEGCRNLAELIIEDGENKLSLGCNYYEYLGTGEGLFYDCPLKKLYLGRNLDYYTGNYYGYSPFYKNLEMATMYLKEITIGNSVTEIGDYAFYYCTGLTSVTIPNSVTEIGSDAFSYCDGLTSIIIPNSVTSIGDRAFYDCDGLKDVTIGNSVTEIGDGAFYHCDGLTDVTIGNSVTEIGNNAFSYCTNIFFVINLSNLTFSKGSTGYGYIAYYANRVINVPNDGYIDGDFVWAGNTLVRYFGKATELILPMDFNGQNYKIGIKAFTGCDGLTSITIPNSVTSIGIAAFSGCYELTDVTIGNSVTSIAVNAFLNCTSLTEVNYNAENCTQMGSGSSSDPLFRGCKSLKTINIGNSVKTIPSYAFSGCSGLTEVNYNAENCTSMSSTVFDGCTNLKTINIGNSVKTIPSYAFSGCSGLTSVTIGNSVTSIGSSAFYDCTGLTEVNISDLSAWCKIDFANDYANPLYYASHLKLNGTEITNLVIPNDIKEIKNYTFCGCTGLTSVTIPNSVTSISYLTFRGCFGLTEVNYNAENCTQIGSGSSSTPVFDDCTNLKTINIGNSVKTIPSYAFYGCSGLTSVTIGNSVTSIGSSAFYDCTGLTEVNISDLSAWCKIDFGDYNANPLYYAGHLKLNGTEIKNLVIPNDIKEIKNYTFNGCNGLKTVFIGKSVTLIGYFAFNDCDGLTVVNISDLSAWCKIEFGNLYANPLYYASHLKLNGTEITNLVIPDDITEIKSLAFSSCTGLKEVTIPNSVTSIGSSAFYDCTGLTSVTIPNSVTEIGSNAFSYCTGLTSVTIPNSVTSIGSSAFYDCTGLTSVTIPNSVTEIGSNAFYYCTGLTSVTIPNSVTEIGSGAFYYCTGLTSITIPNSVTYIGYSAFSGSGLRLIFSYCMTPPACGDGAFYGCYDARLMVPEGTYYDYLVANEWYKFDKIQEFAGIEGVEADNNVVEIDRYDIYGRQLTEPTKGINIIKMSDGSTRKEYVK